MILYCCMRALTVSVILSVCMGCEQEPVELAPAASEFPLLAPSRKAANAAAGAPIHAREHSAVQAEKLAIKGGTADAGQPMANQKMPMNPNPMPPGDVQGSAVAMPVQNVEAAEQMGSIEELLKKVEPGVVRIDVITPEGRSSGSGVLLDDKGTIATNAHVIKNAVSGRAIFNDKSTLKINGIVGQLPGKDLVFLKLELPPKNAAPIKIARQANRGEQVVAIGASHGFSFTVSEGIVSGLRSGEEIMEVLQPGSGFEMDLDSEWVQTTAPISPGNSGGPLLNMRGELIGLNTFTRVGAQNLNFAVSFVHITELLARPGRDLVAFSAIRREPVNDLPIPREGKPFDVARPPLRSFGTIALSDGQTLHEASVNLSSREIASLSEISGLPYIEEHPGGAIAVLASWQKGKLHGYSCHLTPQGAPLQLMTYQAGKRAGTQRTWGASGNREYYAEFKNDRPHGLKCLFREDLPWVIQVCELGKVQAEYLVEMKDRVPTAVHREVWDATQKQLGAIALESMHDYEAKLESSETDLRRGFSAWHRAESQKHKRAALAKIASERNAIQRENQRKRAAAKRANTAGFAREVFRRHMGG